MIRLLEPSDVQQYKRLRLFALKNDQKAFLSSFEQEKNQTKNYFLSRILYSDHSPIYGYYGYFEDDLLIGNIQLSKSSLAKKHHIAYIYELYVELEFRRKGIASELINHAIKKAKTVPELEIIELYVNSGNSASIELYKKLGFKHVATIPKAVKESLNKYQDELIFTYHL